MTKDALLRILWWAIAIGIVIGFGINFVNGISGFDWFVFYYPQAHQVDSVRLLNPLWIYFVIWPIAQFPIQVSYVLFLLLNLGMFWVGAEFTKSKRFFLLLSFPVFWILWFGQLDGFVLFGTALGLKALESKKPTLMGIAILLLLVKPHIGGPLAVLFFLWSPKRDTLLTILLALILSMIAWGWEWPLSWVKDMLTIPEENYVYQGTNISLYPYGLLAWFALLIPKSPIDKVKVALSATLLSVPYAASYSILPLLVLPLPWWVYILGSAPFIFGSNGYLLTMLVPIVIIFLVIYPPLKAKYAEYKLSK